MIVFTINFAVDEEVSAELVDTIRDAIIILLEVHGIPTTKVVVVNKAGIKGLKSETTARATKV